MKKINIIGAGLGGCESAWQLAKRGIAVRLFEMKPNKKSPAHESDDFAELVCSNSLRSDDWEASAIGLLHKELRELDSLIMTVADKTKVPAGGALAVDRNLFSQEITKTLKSHPLIEVVEEEVTSLPEGITIIATGPLTSDGLAEEIRKITGEASMHFFDALAPIVYTDSINMDKAWYQSRYDKGDGTDYLNCAMDKEQYDSFIENLLAAKVKEFHEFETKTPYFEGCLPIEEMARRGHETLRYGPMKPVGLTSPFMDKKPYAIVQLRKENLKGTLMNLVGFQTKMIYSEQERVFRSIPGLENAEFARLGGVHRNTFIKSPILLDDCLRLKTNPNIRFAGQISGCEGYVESAAIGLLSGIFTACELANNEISCPPETTAIGALLSHITKDANAETFQPMNVNFGLFQELETSKKIKGKDRKKLYCERGVQEFSAWKNINNL